MSSHDANGESPAPTPAPQQSLRIESGARAESHSSDVSAPRLQSEKEHGETHTPSAPAASHSTEKVDDAAAERKPAPSNVAPVDMPLPQPTQGDLLTRPVAAPAPVAPVAPAPTATEAEAPARDASHD
jgi:hypothetical protein